MTNPLRGPLISVLLLVAFLVPRRAQATQPCGSISVAGLNQMPAFRCLIGGFEFSNFLDQSLYESSNPLAYDLAFVSSPGKVSITFQSVLRQISAETPASPAFPSVFVWPEFSFDLRAVGARANIFAMAIHSDARADFFFSDPATFGSLAAGSGLFALDGSVGWGGPGAQCDAAPVAGGTTCSLSSMGPVASPFLFADGVRATSFLQLQLNGQGVQGDARALLDNPSWTVELSYNVTPTPEPTTMAILATGLGIIAIAGIRRRRRRVYRHG